MVTGQLFNIGKCISNWYILLEIFSKFILVSNSFKKSIILIITIVFSSVKKVWENYYHSEHHSESFFRNFVLSLFSTLMYPPAIINIHISNKQSDQIFLREMFLIFDNKIYTFAFKNMIKKNCM